MERTHMQIEDVAQAAGVRPSTITSYASRGQMPAAVRCPCCGTGSVWARSDIETWLTSRSGRKPATTSPTGGQ